MEAKRDWVTMHDLRHDGHTVSLLTDHLVFPPRYRGKVLEGEVVEAAEEIIRANCKELDIEVIFLAMNVDHVHLFIKYPPKYSCESRHSTGGCGNTKDWNESVKKIREREIGFVGVEE